jgi:carboxyl-terminal processing protease
MTSLRASTLAGLCLSAFLAGCAGYSPGLGFMPGGRPSMESVIAAGYYEIEETYVQDIDMAQAGMRGLAGMTALDPDLVMERNGGLLTVTRAGHKLGDWQIPAAHRALAWGRMAAEIQGAAGPDSPLNTLAREQVYKAIFDAATAGLDGFSRYVDADTARSERATRTGYGGIGLSFEAEEDSGSLVVRRVFPNAPAEAAGLKPGDVIVSIDGRPASDYTIDQARDAMRGHEGSVLLLGIRRPGLAEFQARLVRAVVVPNMVSQSIENGIGVMRIDQFNATTAADLEQAALDLKRKLGPGAPGFVLDLRDNPGGMLDQAVAVADLFITSGDILNTDGRHPNSRQHYAADRRDILDGKPLVLLINSHSASAAEIVAAALEDSGRALVVGSNSYGKGSVQTVTRLPNDGELLLTWALFYAPSGYRIHGIGVTPEVCVARIASSETLADELRQGHGRPPENLELLRLRATAELGRSPHMSEPGVTPEDVAILRNSCPDNNEDRELTERIGLRLAADSRLFRAALGPAAQLGQSQ